MNGQLEFFSADDGEVMNAAEHFMCTNIEWDPTGRYVATSVTSIHQMENGFNVWLFNGTLLYRCARQRRHLCQFLFRSCLFGWSSCLSYLDRSCAAAWPVVAWQNECACQVGGPSRHK